jgi:hypothetical protein
MAGLYALPTLDGSLDATHHAALEELLSTIQASLGPFASICTTDTGRADGIEGLCILDGDGHCLGALEPITGGLWVDECHSDQSPRPLLEWLPILASDAAAQGAAQRTALFRWPVRPIWPI